MRRTAVIAGSVVAALGIGGVAAVSGGAQAPQGQTLTFVSKGGSFKFVDVAPKARSEEDASAGDAFLLSVGLHNAANKRVGGLDAHCTFTKGGKNLRGVCNGIYSIGKDEIHVSARLTADDDTRGSVVGGTGAYTGARGTFSSIDRPGEANGDPSDETISLLP